METVAPAGDDVVLTGSARAVDGELGVSADLIPEDVLHKVFVTVYRGEILVGQYALDT